MPERLFDRDAPGYDAWYDSPTGRILFEAEVAALRPLVQKASGPGIEVGVGTGRFAQELGIEFGVDVAVAPLRIARDRGLGVVAAAGEWLPFRDRTFGHVMFVFTLCFVENPQRVIAETARVLAPGGWLILGVVPAEGPLGNFYQQRGAEEHRYYRYATFFRRGELDHLIRSAGLIPQEWYSTLFGFPFAEQEKPDVRPFDDLDAGFLVIGARKPD